MNKKMIFPVLTLALAIIACTFNSVTQPTPTNVPPVVQPTVPPVVQPTVPPVAPPSSTGNVLFQDNFSSSNSGWEVGDYASGSVGYGNGYYFVKTTKKGVNMYGAAFQTMTDAVIEVDATEVNGPSNNNTGYGVVCRLQSGTDADMGYYFRISGDGYYSADVASGGNFTTLLTGDDWQTSSAINQGSATNHILVSCNGNHFIFEVNGVTLFEGDDSTFVSGDVALMGTTYEDSTSAEFHFNNFVASQP